MEDPPTSPSAAHTIRTTSNPVTQYAIQNHLMEITSLIHPPTYVEGRSVLAIVKFPPDAEGFPACDGNHWQDVQLPMNYERLRNLGSSKIDRMFEPRQQERIRRRHGFTTLPPGFEYVLDFTPPTEGGELADLTAALWLPKMVKIWFLAGHYVPDPVVENGPESFVLTRRRLAEKAVGACLVLGHDDVCRNESCIVDFSQWEVNPDVPGIIDDDHHQANWQENKPASHIPTFRKVEDYCPIRHRVSILRVLRAINGDGLLLNSAVRLWTVAQTAIHLEVPQAVVDPVTQWLIAPPNTKFIEVCPERAFQLALALKIPSVLITAFKILVSELAVDMAAPVPSRVRPPVTWVKRRRDDYGDFPSDPIDYAARAFVDRMTGYLEILQSDRVFDRLPLPLPEWKRLQDLAQHIIGGPSELLETRYEMVRKALTSTFQQRLNNVLTGTGPVSRLERLLDAQRKHYLSEPDRVPIQVLYADLSPSQKVLTPFFWKGLTDRDLQGDRKSWELSTYLGKPIVDLIYAFNTTLEKEFKAGRFPNKQLQQINGQPLLPHFHLGAFHAELAEAISALCESILYREDGFDHPIQLVLSDHLLLKLNESELNFLPIWADGLDDGSGGVFQDVIPPAEMGPSEPGPAYHTGYTVATDTTTTLGGGPSTVAGSVSDLGMGRLGIEGEGMGMGARSMDANRSSATTGPARGVVVAAGSGTMFSSSGEDRFSVGGGTGGEEADYADAMYADPAGHQAQGVALARYVEGSVSGSESATMSGDGTVENESAGGSDGDDGGTGELDFMELGPDDAFDFDMELSGEDSDSTLGGSDFDIV